MKFKPHSYQQQAITEILNKPSVGLFLDMGLGKTVITLTAVSELIALGEIERVLVIAPLQTARNTWSSEVDKWDHLKGLRVSLILGTAKQRVEALEADADIYVINRENIQWLCDEAKEWKFDMLVVDELSSFKNASAKRFKALRKKLPFFKKVIGLTGTPAANGYMDLWSEVYLLDRGQRLGRTLGIYRSSFFHPARMNGYVVYDWAMNKGAKETIDELLTDLCISMKAVDYLKMPDRIETDIIVEMDQKERKIYDKFGKDQVLPEEGVVAATAGALQGKLLQMANGFVYDEDKNPHFIHDHKLEALEELVEAAQGKPILTFYSFVEDKKRILERIPGARELGGPKDIEAWNRGGIPMLVCHPASAGHGLNLQEGGNTVVWYGLPWSLELYQQANARLYRQGQKSTVNIYHLMTKDTHDMDVLAALERKNITQEELLKALKARIKEWK